MVLLAIYILSLNQIEHLNHPEAGISPNLNHNLKQI